MLHTLPCSRCQRCTNVLVQKRRWLEVRHIIASVHTPPGQSSAQLLHVNIYTSVSLPFCTAVGENLLQTTRARCRCAVLGCGPATLRSTPSCRSLTRRSAWQGGQRSLLVNALKIVNERKVILVACTLAEMPFCSDQGGHARRARRHTVQTHVQARCIVCLDHFAWSTLAAMSKLPSRLFCATV